MRYFIIFIMILSILINSAGHAHNNNNKPFTKPKTMKPVKAKIPKLKPHKPRRGNFSTRYGKKIKRTRTYTM